MERLNITSTVLAVIAVIILVIYRYKMYKQRAGIFDETRNLDKMKTFIIPLLALGCVVYFAPAKFEAIYTVIFSIALAGAILHARKNAGAGIFKKGNPDRIRHSVYPTDSCGIANFSRR